MKPVQAPKKGYDKLGEHDPFDYCHEIVDGDRDDYTGADKDPRSDKANDAY